MSFLVPSDAYDRFMGRYAEPLADQFAAYAGIRAGDRSLDVGCGPGALTARLVAATAVDAVSAVDPSPSFVEATADRFPGIDVREGTAEQLPFADDEFDLTLAQLVVHFMADPVAGLRQMARVTRAGGTVAACVWDHGGGRGPLSTFWRAAGDVDPARTDEGHLAGAREGHLRQLFLDAGLDAAEQTSLTVTVAYASFAAWWEPYTFGVGAAGDYLAGLPDDQRAAIRDRSAELLGDGPFGITASAWTVRGVA